MNIYPNSEVPISEADRSEIEALFIVLMRSRDEAADGSAPDAVNDSPGLETRGSESLDLPFFQPPGNMEDLRSQWGL